MAAATNCGQYPLGRTELYRRYYVGNVRATGNKPWTFVDHPVVDFTSGLIGGIHRLNEFSSKGAFQLLDGFCGHPILPITLLSVRGSANLPRFCASGRVVALPDKWPLGPSPKNEESDCLH